jgi:hypothetical protein
MSDRKKNDAPRSDPMLIHVLKLGGPLQQKKAQQWLRIVAKLCASLDMIKRFELNIDCASGQVHRWCVSQFALGP